MNRARALELGFDYEGTYWGIPVWYRERDYSVAAKSWFGDLLVRVAGRMDVMASYFSGEPGPFVFHLHYIIKEEEK